MELPGVYDRFQEGFARDGARQWLGDQIIQATAGMRVLDIGCGTASVLRALPEVDYLGVDHNPDYISKAKKVHGDRGKFRLIDVNDLDFRPLGSFDRILMIGVLHHLSDNECTSLIAAIKHVLKPNGFLITLDPGLVKGQHLIARTLAKLDRGRYARSPEQYRKLLTTALTVEGETIRHDLVRLPYTHVAFRARTR